MTGSTETAVNIRFNVSGCDAAWNKLVPGSDGMTYLMVVINIFLHLSRSQIGNLDDLLFSVRNGDLIVITEENMMALLCAANSHLPPISESCKGSNWDDLLVFLEDKYTEKFNTLQLETLYLETQTLSDEKWEGILADLKKLRRFQKN